MTQGPVLDLSKFQSNPNFAGAILGGIQSGQSIRKGVLEDYQARKKIEQQGKIEGLQQAYLGGDRSALNTLGAIDADNTAKMLANQTAMETQQREFAARGAYDVLNAPKNLQQQVYSDFIKRGIQSGIFPADKANDTLDDDDLGAMSQMLKQAGKAVDLTTTAASDRDFGLRERELNAARAERQAAREDAAQARKDALEAASRKPMSPEAELKADLDAGRISQDIYDRTIAKKTAPTEKNYKQFQLQAASFADRMAKTEGLLQPFEEKGTDVVNEFARGLAAIPSFGAGKALGNAALNPEQQQYLNAAQEWIRAKLRKESGASIPDSEMDMEYRVYFPVAGDSKAVIKQKAMLRKNNTASMIKQASGAYESQYLGEEPADTSSAPAMGSGEGKVLIFDAQGNLVK